MAKKRTENDIYIPQMQYLAYGLEVDKDTCLKYLRTFGTPNQMTLEEVKAHQIIREKKQSKRSKKSA